MGDRLTDALLSPPRDRLLPGPSSASLGGEPLCSISGYCRPTAAKRPNAGRTVPSPFLGSSCGSTSTFRSRRERSIWRAKPWCPARRASAPSQPLSIVATVAAPIDATALDYEEEMYRLWRALGRKPRNGGS